ncbi:hypothetical protein [Paenimyroides aestuarii]|uniref:NADH dehydrogenase subunit 3 n=1 Tax=Paenimyroides aestuarii TaxID=2968490 RepID=A0ABY5NW08_9FLAO|nr:hypothetical protein [Paenimyroides aestuarii]UUV22740.1 hypothetical protein NPX36_06780 [Paenimyroides aestuarii]
MITKNLSLALTLVLMTVVLLLGIFIENTIYSYLFVVLAIVIGADCIQKFSPQNNKDNE